MPPSKSIIEHIEIQSFTCNKLTQSNSVIPFLDNQINNLNIELQRMNTSQIGHLVMIKNKKWTATLWLELQCISVNDYKFSSFYDVSKLSVRHVIRITSIHSYAFRLIWLIFNLRQSNIA